MPASPEFRPQLRPVEAFRDPGDDRTKVAVRDPSGLADVVLSLSIPALQVLALMDGSRTAEEIRSEFAATFGQSLSKATLDSMLEHLSRAHFLEGPEFEAHYQKLLAEYRRAPARDMPHAPALHIDATGGVFPEMLADVSSSSAADVRGIVAPHLDYPRGRPCYADAYAQLRGATASDRIVVLGTNHFGRSTSVVATGKNFRTPLGTTRVDAEFLASLESRCGDLRRFELDHQREHSVELQVAFLQFLFGAETFRLVPLLCPDPCGPTGTAPCDGDGIDLADFAAALGELVQQSAGRTLLLAGADLSHIGAAFGDERRLDDAYLDEVRRKDGFALAALEKSVPREFLRILTDRDNDTRVCSAGCLFALAIALSDASPRLLRYHQAVDQETQTCVTCAAAVYV